MSRLVWDRVGTRRYETGIDRGVLYLPDGSGVPWNGLTEVQEDKNIEVVTLYYDGVAYLNTRYPGDYSATLRAVTYPDEFLQFDGYAEVDDNPLLLDNQPVEDTFGLSYRTMIGNDVQGLALGYKIHLVYNLTASPDAPSYQTMTNEVSPNDLSWTLSAVPEQVPGYRPTAHVILDSTRLNPYLMTQIEDILYGRGVETVVIDGGDPNSSGLGDLDGGDPSSPGLGLIDGGSPTSASDEDGLGGPKSLEPRLPSLAELVDLIANWRLFYISDNGDGTWSATGPDDLITMVDASTFVIEKISARYVEDDMYEMITT